MKTLRRWWSDAHWWWVLLVLPGSALIVLAALATAGGRSLPVKVVLLSAAVAAFVIPIWIAVKLLERDKHSATVERRREALDPIPKESDTLPGFGVLRFLIPDRASSRLFWGRNREKSKLMTWLDSNMPVVIVDGDALTGKGRLAIEWARSPPSGWYAGLI